MALWLHTVGGVPLGLSIVMCCVLLGLSRVGLDSCNNLQETSVAGLQSLVCGAVRRALEFVWPVLQRCITVQLRRPRGMVFVAAGCCCR